MDELRETVNMYESSLEEKRDEIAYMNKELRRSHMLINDNNTDNLYPIKYSQSNAIWYSFDILYQ